VKFFTRRRKAALIAKLKIEEGDLILFAADQWLTACEILGKIRLYCADVLKAGKLVIRRTNSISLGHRNFRCSDLIASRNRWYSSHHPFTAARSRKTFRCSRPDPTESPCQHY